MAKQDKDKSPASSKGSKGPAVSDDEAKKKAAAKPAAVEEDVAEEEEEEEEDEGEGEEESDDDSSDDDSSDDDSSDEAEAASDDESDDKSDDDADGEGEADADEKAADGEEGSSEEVVLPTQLGLQRYVFSAYFAAAMLLAYVLGKTIHGIWSKYANRDFFVNALPRLAAVPDDEAHILSKLNYSFAIGAVLGIAFVMRLYFRPKTRQWTDEVTTELAKVRWPTRKEVQNSTIVVIAASAASTAYLFLLDRLWAFITGLVYGNGT